MIPLPALEDIIDQSGIAPRIEVLLPIGVRARQLLVRTLLLGMLIVLADHRPAHLTRVHQALITLPENDRRRLGVLTWWKTGPHLLTYRQTERTFGLVTGALARDVPDGLPSARLQRLCDDLLEASIPEEFTDASTSLAVDWTDVETFSRPPSRGTRDCADPEATWGHRSGGGPGQDSELFFGYYASAATMMREEHGPPVPEPARRMTACSCRHDPARAPARCSPRYPAAGIPRGWTRPNRPHPDDALAHLPARRPQPAHPDRLERPPGRRRPPRRGRPAPENTAPPPQDPRQPRRHHRTALTQASSPRSSPAQPAPRRHGTKSTTCCPKQPGQAAPARKRHHIQPAAANHAECQT